MSHHNKFNRQRLVIQRFLFILLLVIIVNFMTAMLAVGQTNPMPANMSYNSSLVGAAAYDVAGWDVAFVGDVNKDGFGDLLIGAPENNKGGLRAGAAYLIFGSVTMPTLSTSLSTADVTFVGTTSRNEAGMKVAGIKDVNGDGLSDFIISAPMQDNGTGKVYMIFGKHSGWQPEAKLSEADVIFSGENWSDNAGFAVASAGDVNNDGLSDLIIGAPRCDSKGNDAGKAYVIFGRKEGWAKNISLANADFIIEGETLLDMFGTSVAGVGDVNKDGIDDIGVGAPFHDGNSIKDIGKIYIFFGKGSFNFKIDATSADASLIGKNADDMLGKYISNGGDFNGDGIVDFSANASLSNGAGKNYLILGKSNGWSQNAIVEDFAPSFTGENPGDCAGVPTLITNLNNDGFSDLLIGASKNRPMGKVYFIEGKAAGWSQNISLANFNVFMTGEKELDYAGQAIAAGDLDSDGYQDVAIGAPGSDVAGVDAGIVYLFHSPFKPMSVSLTITAPNGGESLLVGSEQKIKWTSEGNIEQVTLKYSTDNCASWKSIIEKTPNNGEYSWTVPDDPSKTCRVKVEEAVDGYPVDQSDNVFIIAKPIVESLKIISPNGGEKWLIGTQHQITWNWCGTFAEVKIEYSIDNGTTWKLIDGCTPNDGVYDWTIPSTPSDICLVKISDKNDAIPADVSDAIFSIIIPSESITVISPNGGECWHHGTNHEIKWSSTGLISNVKIQYSIDEGKNWVTIINSTPNDGVYQWTLPSVHSKNCLVKVADVDCNPEDVSNAKFTIWGKAAVTVISPKGGECLHADQEFEIKWEACCCLDSLKIQYSIDGGKDWTTTVFGTANDGKYLWKVPKFHSDSCLIKVANLDCDPEDVSDSLFTIWGKAPVTVVSPNGGECLKPGQQFQIHWEASCCLDSVKIQYSADGGKDWIMIVKSTPNDGCYIWTVPEVHSTNCLVKVADLDCDPEDISDKPFTIWNKSLVTVISPNGGECLHAEQKFEIKWDASCCLDSLKIQYSLNGGREWKTIVNGTENDGKFLWTVPKVHSDSCLIKVADLDCDPRDVSDSLFTIWGKAPVSVVYPNGGECLKRGQKIEIKWEACCCLDSLKIQYSTDGGNDWTSIIYGTENDSSLLWSIPDVHSDNCLIKVADLDCAPEDTSDKPFTIWGKAPVTVISPNGGECLKAGNSFKIKWEASCCLDSLKLQYSIDGGKDWTTIVYGTENDSCFTWTVPEVNSDSCLIKVADLDCDPEDISDSLFTICAPPFITVIQPNGGDTLQTGQEYEIKWHACCFIDTVKIQYSIDGGRNWLSIVYRTKNDSSYIWEIPNTPSDSCLVKVADIDCDPFDVSDSLFVIVSAAMADFDATVMTGSNPLEVKFINLSAGKVNQWRWDFGDGNTSDEQEPKHCYEKSGNYSVKLMAFYPSGIDSITRTNFIQVHKKENFVQMEVVTSTPTLPQNDWTNAIDGDLYGWDGTTVLEGTQPSIIFSLSEYNNRTLNSIGLLTDTGIGYEDRWIRNFQVQVSISGIEPRDFQTVLDTTMTTGEMEVFSIQSISAKYVKLIITTPQSNLVHLGEFQAYFGEGNVTSTQTEESTIPDAFRLAQNYPNPFNPSTSIRFEIPKSSHVKLEIYNVLGEKIRTLFNGRKEAGIYEVNWDGKTKDGITVPSGVYLYILTTTEHREVRKMILTK